MAFPPSINASEATWLTSPSPLPRQYRLQRAQPTEHISLNTQNTARIQKSGASRATKRLHSQRSEEDSSRDEYYQTSSNRHADKPPGLSRPTKLLPVERGKYYDDPRRQRDDNPIADLTSSESLSVLNADQLQQRLEQLQRQYEQDLERVQRSGQQLTDLRSRLRQLRQDRPSNLNLYETPRASAIPEAAPSSDSLARYEKRREQVLGSLYPNDVSKD